MPLHNLINFVVAVVVVVVVVSLLTRQMCRSLVQYYSVSARGCLFYFVVVLMHFNIVSKFHCRCCCCCCQLSFSYKWVYVSVSLRVYVCVCVHSLIAFPQQICVKLLLLILLLFYRFVAKGFANYLCCCIPNCANHHCCNLLHTHTHTQRQRQNKAYQIFRSIYKTVLGN